MTSFDHGDERWSSVAAVLLNLTGLALGYVYLRHWWRAAIYLAATIVLVVVAFATEAANHPELWRALIVVWLGWMVFDGWRLARGAQPHPLTTHNRKVPAIVGMVLIVAMVAGYLLYGAAGRRAYAAGLAAQSRADCATAIMNYELVSGLYELTLSRDIPAAREATEQCVAFTAASEAQARGAYADAVRRYQDYRQAYPVTVLAPYVQDSLIRTYIDWAGSLRAGRNYPGAIQVYRDLLAESGTDPRAAAAVRGEIAATYFEQADGLRATLPTTSDLLRVEQARSAIEALLVIQREFGDTLTGPKVPQAIVDTFTAANSRFTEQRYCDALPVLDYFVTLPPTEAGGVVGPANTDRARAMLECGFDRYRAANYSGAITQLKQFVDTYPENPQVAQARSAIIAAEVVAEVGESLALPAPLGGNSPGDNAVTFYNDSPLEVRVLVAGPTAHEFTLPPCPGCPASYERTEDACPTFAGKPSTTLRLTPGTYHMLGTYPTDTSVEKLADTYVVQSGFDYTSCLYIRRSSPLDRLPRFEPLVPIEPLPVPR
ncbi:MAG: hypothetical protein ACRDTG_15835 [Pseudonocardiaceae bacterium]